METNKEKVTRLMSQRDQAYKAWIDGVMNILADGVQRPIVGDGDETFGGYCIVITDDGGYKVDAFADAIVFGGNEGNIKLHLSAINYEPADKWVFYHNIEPEYRKELLDHIQFEGDGKTIMVKDMADESEPDEVICEFNAEKIPAAALDKVKDWLQSCEQFEESDVDSAISRLREYQHTTIGYYKVYVR